MTSVCGGELAADSTAHQFSDFGARFCAGGGGTYQLMADVSSAALIPDSALLGVGNPARIPAMERIFREELLQLARNDDLIGRWGSSYSPPEGDLAFREALADLLGRTYGWPITSANIALTAGSQAAFFMLFNLFAGRAGGGKQRAIWLPVTPEYVGYASVGIDGPILEGTDARIEELGNNLFKYRLQPAGLDLPANAGAICLSRPTNPTGNIVTDEELSQLDVAARRAGVPFILDCAYGLPFPGIVFVEAQPFWNGNVVLCLSLSKLGLPGLRTGIVIASEEIIAKLGSMMAVMNLAPPSMGPTLVDRLVRSGEILSLAQDVVRPFYQERADSALTWARNAFAGIDWRVHVPEGAFFLWLWFPGLPISNLELYERLKANGIFILSGHHFFPGGLRASHHAGECIRVSYAQPAEVVQRGLQAIAQEIRSLRRS
jgi:valine--pyruvate aminotransferase